ncbi:MAG: hypothetical protein IJD32_02275 [Bacteroidaceae bacterium]|nr:hypothetical protein [Bacteroidaceae bacterium]
MKQLFYILSFISIVCSFVSCSDDDNIVKYGDKQELTGTKWENASNWYGGSIPTDILEFNSNEFTITLTFWNYNAEGEKVKGTETVTHGTYEYKHPHLKLVFEDNMEVDAWISANNAICFYNERHAFNEYVRENPEN